MFLISKAFSSVRPSGKTSRRAECSSARNVTISFGEVSEWSKEHAWKVCMSQGIEGSNPSLTAIFRKALVFSDLDGNNEQQCYSACYPIQQLLYGAVVVSGVRLSFT